MQRVPAQDRRRPLGEIGQRRLTLAWTSKPAVGVPSAFPRERCSSVRDHVAWVALSASLIAPLDFLPAARLTSLAEPGWLPLSHRAPPPPTPLGRSATCGLVSVRSREACAVALPSAERPKP